MNDFHVQLSVPNQPFLAAKPSSLIDVATATPLRVLGFSHKNHLICPLKEGAKGVQ